MKVKEESEKTGSKLNIQTSVHMDLSSHVLVLSPQSGMKNGKKNEVNWTITHRWSTVYGFKMHVLMPLDKSERGE